MKIIALSVAFTAIVVSAAYSINQGKSPHMQESKLFSHFSLDVIIKRIPKAGLELPASISTSSSGGVAGEGEISSYRKDSALICQIHVEEGSFDESSFMEKLKAEVEKEVRKNGARITGGGESDSDFHVDYRLGNINGYIDVIGMRGERNSYKLIYVMREISWK